MNARLALGRALCHPAFGRIISRVFKGKVPSRGFTVDTSNRHISPTNVASIFWGLYERSETRLVRQWLRRDIDVVELGSSLGLVSLTIVKAQEPERRLICVEANPRLIDTITSNFRLNAPSKQVEIVNRAIDYSGQAEISLRIDDGNLGSAKNGDDGTAVVRVSTVTLRQLLVQYRIDDYALVCDIEGAEAEILEEDGGALARCQELIIELHDTRYQGRAYTVEALRALIERAGTFVLVARRRNVHVFTRTM
jgi:FkbM family methyltransferase